MARVSDMYEVEFSSLSSAEWTEVLLGFDDASVYQSWSYGAARWGPGRLHHLILKKDGARVAAAQVAVFTVPLLRSGAAYASWGPMTRPRGGCVGDRKDDLCAAFAALRALECGGVLGNRLCVRLRPVLFEDDRAAKEALEKEGFHPVAGLRPRETILMDISPSLDDLRRSMKRGWRQNLARAERAGLELAEGTSPELWRIFAGLYDEMKARKGFESAVSVPEMGRVQASLPNALKLRLVVCSLEGKPVSAIVYSTIGDTGVVVLSASNLLGRKTCASYLARWRAVQALKVYGCRILDQGGVDFERSPGPALFKLGMAGKGARIVRHVGQYESEGAVASRLVSKIGSLLRYAL